MNNIEHFTPKLREIIQSYDNLCMADPTPVLAMYGAIAGSRFEGQAVHMFLIGSPASGKNEILEATLDLPKTHHVSTFTASSLLSGTSRKERTASSTGGILMEIGIEESGLIVMTEFNSTLNQRQEARTEALAALHDVCTGFYDRTMGVDGGTKLHWHGKVLILAGCTDNIEEHKSTMAKIGERFIYCHMPPMDRKGHVLAAAFNARNGTAAFRKRERKRMTTEFFANLRIPDCAGDLISLHDEEALGGIADFVALARSPVTRNAYSKEVEWAHGAEGPARIFLMLHRLLCGLRVIGVSNEYSLRVVARVGLGSLPGLRRTILEALAKSVELGSASVTIGELRHLVPHYSDTMIRRTLEELEIHDTVKRVGGHTNYWTLTDNAIDNFFTGFNMSDIAFRETIDNP